jgi:hypothetical protein
MSQPQGVDGQTLGLDAGPTPGTFPFQQVTRLHEKHRTLKCQPPGRGFLFLWAFRQGVRSYRRGIFAKGSPKSKNISPASRERERPEGSP